MTTSSSTILDTKAAPISRRYGKPDSISKSSPPVTRHPRSPSARLDLASRASRDGLPSFLEDGPHPQSQIANRKSPIVLALLDLDDPGPPIHEQVLGVAQDPVREISDDRRDAVAARLEAGAIERQGVPRVGRIRRWIAVEGLALRDLPRGPFTPSRAALAGAAAQRVHVAGPADRVGPRAAPVLHLLDDPADRELVRRGPQGADPQLDAPPGLPDRHLVVRRRLVDRTDVGVQEQDHRLAAHRTELGAVVHDAQRFVDRPPDFLRTQRGALQDADFLRPLVPFRLRLEPVRPRDARRFLRIRNVG